MEVWGGLIIAVFWMFAIVGGIADVVFRGPY
jgi:hypothetical protein